MLIVILIVFLYFLPAISNASNMALHVLTIIKFALLSFNKSFISFYILLVLLPDSFVFSYLFLTSDISMYAFDISLMVIHF